MADLAGSAAGPVGLLEGFVLMARMRQFEAACLEGVGTREIHGELHVGVGQEAIAAGMAGALQRRDAVVSTHRCHLHGIAKGVPLYPMLAEVFERESGLCRGRGGHMHLFDAESNFSTTGIVGSSVAVALGYAYAFAIEQPKGQDSAVAVGVTGDGGANIGAFHESMNMAGAWRLPLLVAGGEQPVRHLGPHRGGVSHRDDSRSDHRPTGRGGAGSTARTSRRWPEPSRRPWTHARSRRGPALLEATCHRFRGHFEGDADHYRTNAQKEAMQAHDPLLLARSRLVARGEATTEELDRIEADATHEMRTLLARVRADPLPQPSEAGRFVLVEDGAGAAGSGSREETGQ